MTNDAFHRNYRDMVQATSMCLAAGLLTPALSLIYVLIDTLAWAADTEKRLNGDVKRRFLAWAEEWLGETLACRPIDLYAARCGVLHSLTSKADLVARGEAREVAYAWGTGSADPLGEVLALTGLDDRQVTIHVDTLFGNVCDALDRMLARAEHDPTLAASLREAASLQFVHESKESIEELAALARRLKPGE